jgi:MFS family permease
MIFFAGHNRSKLRAAAGHYREARRSLHMPASARSRRGLDWMNFFIADVQTGFGSFVAFYLAQLEWSPAHIGIALAIGTVAGMLSQIPGGALADAVTWKRGLAAAGIVMTAVAALILAFAPGIVSVFVAQILQGATAGIITPAIGAISLGLVGRNAMSVRTGRNYRYSAAGHALTGALMGVAGAYIAKSAIFVSAAALCIPALIALRFIDSDEIDYARARNAKSSKAKGDKQRDKSAMSTTSILALAKNRELALFTAAIVLFQLADASMLPMMGENLATTRGDHAAIWMSGLIVVPQVVVAILAPWVGFHSEKRGRTNPQWHNRRGDRRAHGDCRRRPDGRHRALQSSERHGGCPQRHCRLAEHERHGVRFSTTWAAPRLRAARGRGGACDTLLVDLPSRDEAGEIRGLAL